MPKHAKSFICFRSTTEVRVCTYVSFESSVAEAHKKALGSDESVTISPTQAGPIVYLLPFG